MKQTLRKLDESFFAQFKTEIQYKKNQLIFGPASEPTGVFFVKSGFVRHYLISSSGKELTFNIYKPGAYFPMNWALNNTPNIYFFESLTNSVLLRAPKKEVVGFVEEYPSVLYDLTKRALSGLDGTTRLMQSLLTGDSYQQIASVLLVLARRFGEIKGKEKIIISLPLTHHLIGTIAGLSRESTTRQLGNLVKNNIISQNNHFIIIKNLKKLEKDSSILFIENAY